MMVKSMKYNGENWEDILYFLHGVGEYRTTLELDGELFESSMYVYLSDGEGTILNVNDFVAYVDGDLVIFNEHDWKRFDRPKSLIEFERVLNIVFPISKSGTNMFDFVAEITGAEIKPYNNGQIWINGIDCIIGAIGNGKFEVNVND